MRFAVIIEKANQNYSAYVPDLPGCVATGSSPGEVETHIREAMKLHLEELEREGLGVPVPTTTCQYVDLEG